VPCRQGLPLVSIDARNTFLHPQVSCKVRPNGEAITEIRGIGQGGGRVQPVTSGKHKGILWVQA